MIQLVKALWSKVIYILIVALIIRIESPGPAFYKQERLGKNGKIFMMYKLRSMRTDAEKDGPQWATDDDPRCTRVGKVIRAWRIDELPQIWNVIKGDMSVVGPRPEREYFYNDFEKDNPQFRNRLLVDQGLTCIGQADGGYGAEPAEKLAYDVEYINKQSIWTDIKCLCKTVVVIFSHKGSR